MPEWVSVALTWSPWGLGGLAVLLAVGWCRSWFLCQLRQARLEGELTAERRVREASNGTLRDRMMILEETLRGHGKTVDSCGSAIKALLQAAVARQRRQDEIEREPPREQNEPGRGGA